MPRKSRCFGRVSIKNRAAFWGWHGFCYLKGQESLLKTRERKKMSKRKGERVFYGKEIIFISAGR